MQQGDKNNTKNENRKNEFSKAMGLLATISILIVSYTGAGLFLAYLINSYLNLNLPEMIVNVACALLGFALGLFNILRFAQKSKF